MIKRYDINENYAHSGIIKAGNYYFIGYCSGNIDKDIKSQVNGAIDYLEKRLQLVNLTLDDVVKLDLLFKNISDIPKMEEVFKKRFKNYPVRKSIETNFNHDTLLFQLDAIAYKEEGITKL